MLVAYDMFLMPMILGLPYVYTGMLQCSCLSLLFSFVHVLLNDGSHIFVMCVLCVLDN